MTTGRPAGYSAISNYSRVEILHLVQDRPDRTVAELVSATSLHPNTVREHLQRLIDDGNFDVGRLYVQTIALAGAIDGRKIFSLRSADDLTERISRNRSGDVLGRCAAIAGETDRHRLRNRRSDRTGEIECRDLNGRERRADHARLPAFGDAGLARQKRGDVLIARGIRP